MIKRTIFIGNPSKLHCENNQLLIEQKPLPDANTTMGSVPIEDIGIVIIDNPQISITTALFNQLMENNVAVVTCDKKHHPQGLMLPYVGNSLLSERYKYQIESSEPLKKQLWQQIVVSKIRNQAFVLENLGLDAKPMRIWSNEVASGDTRNLEGVAAAWYFDRIFMEFIVKFKRSRDGDAPNNILNYMYAIIRAAIARAIVGAGLLPALGVHHRNKYNPFCLADDLMEPFRPFADQMALQLIVNGFPISELNTALKRELLGILTVDVIISGNKSPLFNGTQKLVDSLVNVFKGEKRKLELPSFI